MSKHPDAPVNGPPADPPRQRPAQAATPKSKEHRSVPRFQVKWRAVALLDEQSRHHGFIKDISIHGAAVFLERNLQAVEVVKLHIQIPPSHTLKAPHVIEVYGKVVYTVYDNRELLFRAGICFLKFGSERDPALLEACLTGCQPKIG